MPNTPLTDAEKDEIMRENKKAMDELIRIVHDAYDVPVDWPFCEPLTHVEMRKVPRA